MHTFPKKLCIPGKLPPTHNTTLSNRFFPKVFTLPLHPQPHLGEGGPCHAFYFLSVLFELYFSWTRALQINIIPLPVTMNREIKKPPVKLNFGRSQ